MRIGDRNAANIETSISDFDRLRRVQRELSESTGYHRAMRRAQSRRIDTRKPSITQATNKDGIDTNPLEPTYIFGYNPLSDKWVTNKGERELGNRAAPEWGEKVLALGDTIIATPAGDPFVDDDEPIIPDLEIDIDVTIGFTGKK